MKYSPFPVHNQRILYFVVIQYRKFRLRSESLRSAHGGNYLFRKRATVCDGISA